MRRSLVVSAIAALLALPALAGAVDGVTEISIHDNSFAPKTPATRNFEPGPSFHWSRAGSINRHNVRQDERLFRSGNPTSGPINLTIRASAGSYHYYCEIHRSLGMKGRVKVRPVALPDSLLGEIAVQWADSNTNTGSRFDVRYRVDQGNWKIWRNDTTTFTGNFGHNDKPVDYKPNRHTYQVAVRSERGNVTKHSDWSPPVTLNP